MCKLWFWGCVGELFELCGWVVYVGWCVEDDCVCCVECGLVCVVEFVDGEEVCGGVGILCIGVYGFG